MNNPVYQPCALCGSPIREGLPGEPALGICMTKDLCYADSEWFPVEPEWLNMPRPAVQLRKAL